MVKMVMGFGGRVENWVFGFVGQVESESESGV